MKLRIPITEFSQEKKLLVEIHISGKNIYIYTHNVYQSIFLKVTSKIYWIKTKQYLQLFGNFEINAIEKLY